MGVDNDRPVVWAAVVFHTNRQNHVPFAGRGLEHVQVLIVGKGRSSLIDFGLQWVSTYCNRLLFEAFRLRRVSTAQQRLGRAGD